MSSEGALILVTGPSGAGKDSILRGARAALADEGAVRFARRVITRAPDVNEDNLPVTPAQFTLARGIGGFLLSWNAHGLDYGLPASIGIDLACGVTVVANVSRGVVNAARRLWPNTHVVLVTASPETLRDRLTLRGRNENVLRRMSRAEHAVDVHADLTLVNEADLNDAVVRLADFIRGVAHGGELSMARAENI